MSPYEAPFDPADFIRVNLPVEAVPSVPEIRLHRAGPRSGLWRLAESDKDFGSPYWAHRWGGGLVLARYLLDHPQTVAGRSVLDLGAGSGIVAIAAAKAGASRVMAADTDRYAVTATGLNAVLNGVSVSPVHGDLTNGDPPEVAVVAVGDLFYEQDLAGRVMIFLDRCLAAGIEVLIGDPWRAHLPRARLEVLAESAVADFGDGDPGSPSAVFSYLPAGRADRPVEPSVGRQAARNDA